MVPACCNNFIIISYFDKGLTHRIIPGIERNSDRIGFSSASKTGMISKVWSMEAIVRKSAFKLRKRPGHILRAIMHNLVRDTVGEPIYLRPNPNATRAGSGMFWFSDPSSLRNLCGRNCSGHGYSIGLCRICLGWYASAFISVGVVCTYHAFLNTRLCGQLKHPLKGKPNLRPILLLLSEYNSLGIRRLKL